MAEATPQYSYMAYAVISLVPDKKWTVQTSEDSDSMQSFLWTELIQALLFCSLSGNLEKFIPDAFGNRFVQFITQQLTGILSTNPSLWQWI